MSDASYNDGQTVIFEDDGELSIYAQGREIATDLLGFREEDGRIRLVLRTFPGLDDGEMADNKIEMGFGPVSQQALRRFLRADEEDAA